MLYHFHVPGFGGGYVGVDIFFVVSGYVITRTLLRDMDEGGSFLLRFYERRARRLVPALALVCATTTLLAIVFFLPRELIRYGDSLTAVGMLVPNLYFWRATNSYFSPVAETQPLLHLWSLGVEEQFYLIFPLYLWLVARLRLRRVAMITAVLMGCSFALAIWAAPRMPNATFYLPVTRAWELLAGALLSLLPLGGAARSRAVAETAGWVGFLLIIVAATSYGSWAGYNGFTLLAPVLGAALIIVSGSAQARASLPRLLSARPFVLIGLLSYSLYLWTGRFMCSSAIAWCWSRSPGTGPSSASRLPSAWRILVGASSNSRSGAEESHRPNARSVR